MITRDIVKAEIDRVQEKYLAYLYKMIKGFNKSSASAVQLSATPIQDSTNKLDWDNFIKSTYGSLAEDPIARGDQGQFEVREGIE